MWSEDGRGGTAEHREAATRGERPFRGLTKGQAVYAELRARILNGSLQPGETLNQEALAAELGISITPLREALRRLKQENLIMLEPHRKVSISRLSQRELRETYAIRGELDPLAARLAAVHATASQIDQITRLAHLQLPVDAVLRLENNRAFHRAVYAASDNAALTDLLDHLWDRTDRYRFILVADPAEASMSMRDHVAIADAIQARAADAVSELMRHHVERSLSLIEVLGRLDDERDGVNESTGGDGRRSAG